MTTKLKFILILGIFLSSWYSIGGHPVAYGQSVETLRVDEQVAGEATQSDQEVVKPWWERFWGGVKKVGGAIVGGFKKVGNALVGGVQQVGGWIWNGVQWVWSGVQWVWGHKWTIAFVIALWLYFRKELERLLLSWLAKYLGLDDVPRRIGEWIKQKLKEEGLIDPDKKGDIIERVQKKVEEMLGGPRGDIQGVIEKAIEGVEQNVEKRVEKVVDDAVDKAIDKLAWKACKKLVDLIMRFLSLVLKPLRLLFGKRVDQWEEKIREALINMLCGPKNEDAGEEK